MLQRRAGCANCARTAVKAVRSDVECRRSENRLSDRRWRRRRPACRRWSGIALFWRRGRSRTRASGCLRLEFSFPRTDPSSSDCLYLDRVGSRALEPSDRGAERCGFPERGSVKVDAVCDDLAPLGSAPGDRKRCLGRFRHGENWRARWASTLDQPPLRSCRALKDDGASKNHEAHAANHAEQECASWGGAAHRSGDRSLMNSGQSPD